MVDERSLSQSHYRLIRGLIDTGACPTKSDLAGQLSLPVEQVGAHLRSLADIHGVVLHPHTCEPWIINPFSLTPTINRIEANRASWWAPCPWCALGVATLVRGDVRIHTRYGAESEPLLISAIDGEHTGFEDVLVHFAIPPARAWDNVHQHCSMVYPSIPRKRLTIGASAIGSRAVKRFLFIKSLDLPTPGTASIQIPNGVNGAWPKRTTSSTKRDCALISGISGREAGSSDRLSDLAVRCALVK